MSHVQKLKSSGKYQARWIDPSGHERTKVFKKKGDADRHCVAMDHAVLSGTYIDPTAGLVKIGVLAEQWFDGKVNIKETTRARYRNALDVHVLPRWKNIPVSRVRHGQIQEWITTLVRNGQSPASVAKIHNVLSAVL